MVRVCTGIDIQSISNVCHLQIALSEQREYGVSTNQRIYHSIKMGIGITHGLSPVHLIHVCLMPVRLTKNAFGSFRLSRKSGWLIVFWLESFARIEISRFLLNIF